MHEYNKGLLANSQELRKNMTREEKHIWYDFLRLLPVEVKRQKILYTFIVDFYVPRYKTIIEIDGRQHETKEMLAEDGERDKFFSENGITVLRYKNRDINQRFEVVCNDILNRFGLSADDLRERR